MPRLRVFYNHRPLGVRFRVLVLPRAGDANFVSQNPWRATDARGIRCRRARNRSRDSQWRYSSVGPRSLVACLIGFDLSLSIPISLGGSALALLQRRVHDLPPRYDGVVIHPTILLRTYSAAANRRPVAGNGTGAGIGSGLGPGGIGMIETVTGRGVRVGGIPLGIVVVYQA